ncbi:MAG: hypothetical protein HC892_06075 [Saprospiraceae bacterium]|nr:hypothetical protein [Saprospiraceae bacterium]
MKVNRLVLTSDLLRVANPIHKHEVIANHTKWMHKVLHQTIKYATRKELEIVEWEHGSSFDGDEVYALLGMPSVVESWIELYYQKEVPKEITDYFSPFFKDSLVIGFEISPFMIQIFKQLDVPCINLMWDPVRFMDDIFFCFTTNTPSIFERLVAYQLPQILIYQTADLLRARFLRQNPRFDIEGVIIFGQTKVDRSLIKNTYLKKLEDYAAQIQALQQFGQIFFKPHPFDLESEARTAFFNQLQMQTLRGEYNTYDLLCSEQIKHVAAISSGTLIEAVFFEKPSSMFNQGYYHFHSETPTFSTQQSIAVFNEF